jgi:hypothetical protein
LRRDIDWNKSRVCIERPLKQTKKGGFVSSNSKTRKCDRVFAAGPRTPRGGGGAQSADCKLRPTANEESQVREISAYRSLNFIA